MTITLKTSNVSTRTGATSEPAVTVDALLSLPELVRRAVESVRRHILASCEGMRQAQILARTGSVEVTLARFAHSSDPDRIVAGVHVELVIALALIGRPLAKVGVALAAGSDCTGFRETDGQCLLYCRLKRNGLTGCVTPDVLGAAGAKEICRIAEGDIDWQLLPGIQRRYRCMVCRQVTPEAEIARVYGLVVRPLAVVCANCCGPDGPNIISPPSAASAGECVGAKADPSKEMKK